MKGKPPLSALLDVTENTAKDYFRTNGKCPPVFVAVSPEHEELMVIPAPWQDETHKRAILSAIRNMFRQKGVTAYACASEIWTTSQDRNTSPAVRKLMPMQRDDREEALLVFAVNQSGEQAGRCYDILREPGEPLTLEINQAKTAIVGGMRGLLFELLDKQ